LRKEKASREKENINGGTLARAGEKQKVIFEDKVYRIACSFGET